MFKAIKEFLKEEGRIIILVIISGAITALIDYIAKEPIDPTMLAIIMFVLTGVSKGIDKAIHKYGKAKDNKALTKGIVRF